MTAPADSGPPAAHRARLGLALALLLLLYAALRILVWHRTVLVEDTDSIGLLYQIRTFRSLDLRQLQALNADKTPFYSFFAALTALPGWPLDFAARLCSFLFSLILFGACALLGLELGAAPAAFVGLFFLSVNPALVPFSIAILTEPSYVAVVYLGLVLFLIRYRRPTPGTAALLGVVFGLAFLDRTEGIIFVVLIPALQAAHGLLARAPGYDRRRLATWVGTYVVVYCAVVAPQVWRVSTKMGGFAINGREAWSVLLGKELTGEQRDARRAGLDYSPSQINIRVALENPALRGALTQKAHIRDYVGIVLTNEQRFEHAMLPHLVGAVSVILFGAGLAGLVRRGHRFPALGLVVFVGATLVPPFVQHMLLRHVMIVVPAILVVAGVGVTELAGGIGTVAGPLAGQAALAGLCLLWLGTRVTPLRAALSPPTFNREYDPATLVQPAALIRHEAALAPPDSTKIVARRAYLAWTAGGTDIDIPFTDLPGLRRYVRLNQGDYLFLEYRQIQAFPFLAAFGGDSVPAGFTRLYREDTPTMGRLELYKVTPAPADSTPVTPRR